VLDATPAGEPVYRHLGFRAASSSSAGRAWRCRRLHRRWPPTGSARIADDFEAIAALDQGAFGVSRRALLLNLFRRGDSRAWLAQDGSGFVLARTGQRAIQIGPVVAQDEAGAIALLASALNALTGPVFLDVPKRWTALGAWLAQAGFTRQRRYLRMSLGLTAPLTCDDRSFVLAGAGVRMTPHPMDCPSPSGSSRAALDSASARPDAIPW
jgi:hypothetical protein